MKLKTLTHLMCTLGFLLFTTAIFAQSTITGKITDETGSSLFGATVQVKGTSTGITADADGMYSIQAKEGDVLIFSFIGYTTQLITVGNSTTINVQMQPGNVFDEIVVSSSRKPIRKLQATTSINTVSAATLEIKQPESFTEAIENTPGVTVDNSQGRKGGFNIRGFPGGNVYTTTLLDGLPASGTANLSAGTQEYVGIDPNVERVEVVRGAAATLFGRSSAAGAVNIITRTGGSEHGGSFSLTKYSNVSDKEHKFDGAFDYRADFNFNGPLNDKLRYNIGGYILNDSGQKEQNNRDKGAQIRANLDWMPTEGTKIRLSGGTLNNEFQNVTDSPWDLGRGTPGAGFSNNNTFFNDADGSAIDRDFTSSRTDADGVPITRNPGEFKEKVTGSFIGLDATFDLGSGWSINPKMRYQNYDFNDINEFTSTGFYDVNSTVSRLISGAEQQSRDFVSEFRISNFIESGSATHNISGGVYYGTGVRDRVSFLLFYNGDVSPRPTFGGGFFLVSSATTSHREEKTTGIFIGDEMVFNEKLSVNIAFRYDWFNGYLSDDPEELRQNGFDVDPSGTLREIDEDFKDYSGSIGANYLIGESSAVYANYLRAFSLPAVTSFNFTVPEENEIINNLELGYRAGLGDLTVDLTGFYTTIDNRVALQFDSASSEFIPLPAGSNEIIGGEIAVAYAPKAVKGLVISGSTTLQKSEYTNFVVPLTVPRGGTETNVDQSGPLFGLPLIGSGLEAAVDVKGNQVQRTPKAIYNLNIGYNSKSWGANFNGFTYTGVFGDATNLLEQPDLSIYNAGAYYKFKVGSNDELKLSVLVKNVFDGERPVQLGLSSGDDSTLIERQMNPTNVDGRLAFSTLQNPRRTLITLAYKF